MNTIPDLIPLHDNRPGLRALLEVEIREPLATSQPGRGGSPSRPPSSSAERHDDSQPLTPNMGYANSNSASPDAPTVHPLLGERAGVRESFSATISNSQPSTLNSQPSLDFIASTATLDRYHEVIEPAGWRLDSYRRNPVFQNAHNYGDILFTLGKALIAEVRQVGRAVPSAPPTPSREAARQLSTLNPQLSTYLFLRVQFATEVNPVARIAYGLYRGGFLNAVSVGFIPLRWEDAQGNEHTSGRARSPSGPFQTNKGRALSPRAPLPGGLGEAALPSDLREAVRELSTLNSQLSTTPSTLNSQPSTKWRRRYLEQELLEVSAVAIPANPDALALGVKSGAVSKADLRDTLELLRGLMDDADGRARSPSGPFPETQTSSAQRHDDSQLSTLNSQLLHQPSTINNQLVQLARELRRVMRKA